MDKEKYVQGYDKLNQRIEEIVEWVASIDTAHADSLVDLFHDVVEYVNMQNYNPYS